MTGEQLSLDWLADAEAAVQKVRKERRDDTRLRRERIGKGKSAMWNVWCASCGTRLVVGDKMDDALALARINARARPCCDVWRQEL